MPEQPPELVVVPVDLALVPLDELRVLETAAVAEFDALKTGEVTSTSVERAMRLTDDLARVRDEITVKETREQQAATREAERLAEQMQTLSTKVTPGAETPGDGGAGGGTPDRPAVGITVEDIEKIVAAAAQGTAAVLAANDERRYGKDLAQRVGNSLAEAQRHVDEPHVPEQQLVVTASVDIPGVAQGTSLQFDDVVDAFHKRARNMGITASGDPDVGGAVVVTVRNQFEQTVDDRTSLASMDELFKYLTQPAKQEALVAGGGWCAPSEIRYNFFNIACEDGLIDLPTFGVSRGGIQHPVSPSMADVQLAPFVSGFSNTSNPWLWTETDDQATVTGVPNKPCVRVPCPTFTERRLECYGICLTAGNLTNDAYPEATANFLRLLMAAHAHAMNARIIQTMVGLSTAPVAAGGFAGSTDSAFNQILGGLSLAAADYRARYGMCRDDILEVVLPYWVEELLQSDLAWHGANGDELLSVTRDRIRSYFSARGLRAQFVGDWQVRGTGQFGNATPMNAWPATVDVMIYAAGTFLLGNGLTLDLGVTRDSALNAENDYTAAWSEECHLVAKVGHESRQYRITFNVGGPNLPLLNATPPGL